MAEKQPFAKRIFVPLAILAVPAYTVFFGTLKDPVKYTLSKIGNFFNHRPDFIMWGILCGILLVLCVVNLFHKAGYKRGGAKSFLFASCFFLIATVLVPNIKENTLFFYYTHIACCVLFVSCLWLSIVLFLKFLYDSGYEAYAKSVWLFILCAIIPALLFTAYGQLTGVAEMAFFVCISAFLLTMNHNLDKFRSIEFAAQ